MSIQGHFYERYKGDRYLRDRQNEAIDLPEVKGYLNYIPTRSSRQLINRLATQLSDKSMTSGTLFATMQPDDETDFGEEEVMYSLGLKYGGIQPRNQYI